MPTFNVDFHSHCQGDPVDDLKHTVQEHLDAAIAAGLDAVAITWHTKVFDQPEWIDYAAERGLLLIPGVEVNLNGKYHTVVLNVQPGEISGQASVEELRELRRRRGDSVFVFAPHPYYVVPSCLGRKIYQYPDLFDAVEWCHLHCRTVPGMINPNERARRWAQRFQKPMLQTSDAHSPCLVGRWSSQVEAEACTTEALFSAMRAGAISFEPESISLRDTARKVRIVAWDYVCGAVGVGPVARQKKLKKAESTSTPRPKILANSGR